MDKSDNKKRLLEEFPIPAYDKWLDEVSGQLKGAPFEKKLVSETAEGIKIQPMYLEKDVQKLSSQLTPPGQYPFIRGNKASGNAKESWAISQLFQYPTAEEFNKIAGIDLDKGLTCLKIVLDDAGKTGSDPDQSTEGLVGAGGVSIVNKDDMAVALNNIDPTAIKMQLEGGIGGYSLLFFLLKNLRDKNGSFSALKGGMVFDPLAELAASGSLPSSLAMLYERMAELVAITKTVTPDFRTIGIDARPYGEGGGSAAQELGFAIAAAVTYIKELLQKGLTIDEIASAVHFNYAIGSDFFLEISKLRAARFIWARVISLFGGSETSQKAVIHSMTSRYNKTVYDPYVNMLRMTTEAFSAVIGGTDAMTVAPFDELYGLPDEMSRRNARNLQIILKEECHGNRVIDPAGGSWFIENLTDQLADSAWKIFQEVEKAGGMMAALKSGYVQNSISEIDQQRRKNLGQRKEVAVGTNMYANLEEKLPPKRLPDYKTLWQSRSDFSKNAKSNRDSGDLADFGEKLGKGTSEVQALVDAAIQAIEKGVTLGELTGTALTGTVETGTIAPIKMGRRTEDYEKLRQKSAEFKEKTGKAPTVFLANMGPLKQHKPRADFTAGFFQPAGFSIMSPDGFNTTEDAVKAAVLSEAPIVVICSTDDTYPDLVPDLATQLKQAKPEVTVIVAGYPKDYIDSFKEKGVDDFIHIKADNLQMLTKLQAKAGA